MTNNEQYNTRIKPNWCLGCGNFGLFLALKQAFSQLNLSPDEVCLTYDVGCSSNMAGFMNTYGFNSLHGRSLATGVGISLASQLPVISIAGDGGAYGEGLNHFIASCRADFNLTFIVSNNQLYSLTTGQASPTTFRNKKTKSTPYGLIEKPFNPLTSAIVNHASFVSRGFTGNIKHLTSLIIKAIHHPGFALIDVLSPCATWNKKEQPFSWYQEKVYQLKKEGYPFNKALELAQEQPKKLPIGIFYQEKRSSYQSCLPEIKQQPLNKQVIKNINIQKLIKEFI